MNQHFAAFLEASVMNRRIFPILGVFVIPVLVSVCLAAPDTPPAESSGAASTSRQGGRRQRQLDVLSRIDAQVAKIRAAMESSSRSRRSWRGLSEDERNELRAKSRKAREAQRKSIAMIEDQILLLKGRNTVHLEYDDSMDRLYGILELARMGKTKETTAAVEALIAARNMEFDRKMARLGMQ